MAETPPEIELTTCDAFPGLGFLLDGDRDKLGLHVVNLNTPSESFVDEDGDTQLCERTPIPLLQLVRNFGTIDRLRLGAIPGLALTKEGKLSTTEELAATTALAGYEPTSRRFLPPQVGTVIHGTGDYSHLQFFIQAGTSDIFQVLCERRDDPENMRSTILSMNRYGRITFHRMPSRTRNYYAFPSDNGETLALSTDNPVYLPHPVLDPLRFRLETSPATGAILLVGQHSDTGTYTVLSITRDGTIRRNTSVDLPGLLRTPVGHQVPDIDREQEDNQEALRLLTRCHLVGDHGDEPLPREAAVYRPAPGQWRMKPLRDGRRRFFMDREYLKFQYGETVGCTTFILPPLVTAQASPPDPSRYPIAQSPPDPLMVVDTWGGEPPARPLRLPAGSVQIPPSFAWRRTLGEVRIISQEEEARVAQELADDLNHALHEEDTPTQEAPPQDEEEF